MKNLFPNPMRKIKFLVILWPLADGAPVTGLTRYPDIPPISATHHRFP